MADFDVKFASTTPGGLGSFVSWVDAPSGLRVSRLNPTVYAPHRYLRILPGATYVEFHAWIGGQDSPPDASLGGDLFSASWVEWPGAAPPILVPTVGFSSVIGFTFGASATNGHHLLNVWRNGHGAFAVGFEREPA